MCWARGWGCQANWSRGWVILKVGMVSTSMFHNIGVQEKREEADKVTAEPAMGR